MKKQGRWQELLRLMGNKGKIAAAGKLAAGAASITVLSVGGHHMLKQIQFGSTFRPELFANSQTLHGNQITFPENEEYKGKNQTPDPGENEQLQHDRRAEDAVGKEKQDQASFEMDAEDPNAVSGESQNIMVAQDEFNSSMVLPSDLAENAVLLTDGGGAESGDTIYSGGVSAGGGTEENAGTGGTASENGAASGSAGGGGGTGTAGGAGSANPSQPEQPSNPGNMPSVEPVTPPDPAPDTDKPLYDPDYPDDSKQPEPPKTPSFPGGDVVIPSFPKDGISSESGDAELIITDLFDADSDFLYQGAVLTDWKLFCSIIAYVKTSEGIYRLTNYSDYFKIGAHPDVAGEELTVTFSFRPNLDPETEWQNVDHVFHVKYAKVVVMNAENEDGSQEEFRTEYLEKGDSVYLSSLTRYLYEKHEDWAVEDFWGDRYIDRIFPGWSLQPDGELLHGTAFQPDQGGRYVLYPKERQPVPDGYQVKYQEGWDSFDDTKYVGRQILTAFPDGEKDPVIPEGIQEVDCWFFPTGEDSMFTSITIPESVDRMLMTPAVLEAYHVSPYNRMFKEKDGLLYNYEKTEILGIPVKETEIEIPSSVENIGISAYNKLEKIILHSTKPPKLDLSLLKGTVIHIPAGSYLEYVSRWGNELPNGSTIETEAGENTDFKVTDDGVFSGDMKVLYRAPEDCYGLYEVPGSVERIAEGAFADAEYVDSIRIPASVTKLDMNSLNGTNIGRIYFDGTTPPEISEETFGEDGSDWAFYVRIWVPKSSGDAYKTAWNQKLETLDDILIEGFQFKEESGIRYLEAESDGATLLTVPDNITSFEEIDAQTNHTMPWCRIGAAAFGTSEGMEILEVPETVEEIGSYAFTMCKDLQVLVSHAKDVVYVGASAFPNLELVAFDASYVSFDDGSTVSGMLCLGPINGSMGWLSGDEITAFGWGDSYVVKNADEGSLFYSVFDDEDYPAQSYLLWGSSYIEGAIEAPEGHLIREIRPTALNGSEGSFSISAEEASEIYFIGSSAFANSGLSGSLILSDKLQSIDAYAFDGCKQLEELIFSDQPSDIKLMIEDMAFEKSGLRRVVFPENLFNMGSLVFQGCTDLEEITFSGSTSPILSTYSYGYPYMFGFEENEKQVSVILKDASCKEAYRDAWKYYFVGYGPDTDRDTIWKEKQMDLLYQLLFGELWGDVDVDLWPEDQEMFEEDGLSYRENFQRYLDDCTDYATDLAFYEAEMKACDLLGLDEVEQEKPVRPNVQDYLEDELPSTELASPSNAIINDEILDEDGITDPEDPDEEETEDSDQDDKDSSQTPGNSPAGDQISDFLPPENKTDDTESGGQTGNENTGNNGTGGDDEDDLAGETGADEDDKPDGAEDSGSDSKENQDGSGADGTGGNDAGSDENHSGESDSDNGNIDSGESGSDTGNTDSGENDSDDGNADSGKNDSDTGNSSAGENGASASDSENSTDAGSQETES